MRDGSWPLHAVVVVRCGFFEWGIIRWGCMCLNTPSLCCIEGDEGFALSIVCRDNIQRGGGMYFSFFW